jgi:phosphomannomutase
MTQLTCFKAYDIRGKLGTELNEEIAYKIGRAYGQIYQPKKLWWAAISVSAVKI